MSVGCSAQRRRRPVGVKGQRSKVNLVELFRQKKNSHNNFPHKKKQKQKLNMRSVFTRPRRRAFPCTSAGKQRSWILSKLINIPEYGVNAQCKQLWPQNHHSLRVIIPVDTCFVHAGVQALLGLLSLSVHTVVKVMHV